jgi:imidazole glycerol-phosphate synthase subunit HisH
MAEVTLVNYGLGNIQAFAHIYERLNIAVDVATTPDAVASAKRLVLPGVGAFDWAMARLNGSGLREPLDEAVTGRSVPVLGVCVGMQMMGQSSDEGELPGLGWIPSRVVKFHSVANTQNPLPHMGWNDVLPSSSDCLFKGLDNPRFYFLHSYCIEPADPSDALASASYGGVFTAAVRRKNVFGTQFHPEKSHQWGIGLLRNFAEL